MSTVLPGLRSRIIADVHICVRDGSREQFGCDSRCLTDWWGWVGGGNSPLCLSQGKLRSTLSHPDSLWSRTANTNTSGCSKNQTRQHGSMHPRDTALLPRYHVSRLQHVIFSVWKWYGKFRLRSAQTSLRVSILTNGSTFLLPDSWRYNYLERLEGTL